METDTDHKIIITAIKHDYGSCEECHVTPEQSPSYPGESDSEHGD